MIGFFKHKINGDTWVMYLIDDHDDVISEDAGAETDTETKEVFFKKGELSQSVVNHEIWHVYCSYLYLDSADIPQKDFEEITAAMFADKAEQIITNSKEVYQKLLKIKDRYNEKKSKNRTKGSSKSGPSRSND